MRPALQRLLGSPSALSVLRNAIESSNLCQSCWAYDTAPQRITKRPQSFRALAPSTKEKEPVDVRITRDGDTFGGTGCDFNRLGRRPDQLDSYASDAARKSNNTGIRRVLDEDVRTWRNLERSKKERDDGITNKYRALRRQRYSRQESLESPMVSAITPHVTSQKVRQVQKLGEDCLRNSRTSLDFDEKRPSECYVDPPKANDSGADAVLVKYQPGGPRRRVLKDGLAHVNHIVWHDSLDIEAGLCKVNSEETSSAQYTAADVDSPTLNDCTSIDPEIALTQQAPDLQWKSMLKTQRQYEYQSSVDRPASRGPRLVEYKNYASDSGLWLELVVYRRGHFGTKGLKALWEAIQALNVEIPTEGANADYLWTNFVQMGLHHDMLASVVDYAIRLQDKTKSHWRRLYSNIISFNFSNNRRSTYEWHSKLYERFPPTAEQFMLLFDLVHKQGERSTRGERSSFKMLKLQLIYKDLPFSNLYEDIIIRLYQNWDFKAAASWHNILIMKKDVPAELRLYRPLFRYMVLHGDHKLLGYMVDKTVEAGVTLPTFIKHPLPVSPASQKLIDQRLAEVHGIEPKTVGDEFCARLIATVWFSLSAVIKILCILGVDTLGSSSLREVVVRAESDPKAVVASIDQLEAAGIALGRTTYCSLVKRLAVDGNDRMLESVIQCDLHPETFDDQDLQERLLEDYYRKNDQLQVDRTLAILTAKLMEVRVQSEARVISNVYLRLHLKRKDIKAVNSTLEHMHASRIPVDRDSCKCVNSLFTYRAFGKRPYVIHDVFVIINIQQNILRSGGVVPCIAWIEVARRLGMTGHLEEFEKLALWLAKYYSSSPGGPSLGMLPGPETLSRNLMRRLVSAPPQLDPAEESHPLYILFPPRAQQAIVAWGFQFSRPGYKDWRWGLQLLLKLKLFRVYIKRSTVAEACKLRLRNLFTREDKSKKLINRTTRAQNAHSLSYYVEEMEKIGGTSLLFGKSKPSTQSQRIRWMKEDIKCYPWKSQTARRERAAKRNKLLVGLSVRARRKILRELADRWRGRKQVRRRGRVQR